LSGWALQLGVSVGKVLSELFVGLELRVQLAYTQLVVVRDFDLIDLGLLEQLLLAAKHVLEKVLVNGRFIRQVVL
jgi:hypothetical protein